MSWAQRRFERLLQVPSFKEFCEAVCERAANYTHCSIAIWGPDGRQVTKRWMHHDICKRFYGDLDKPGPGRRHCDGDDKRTAETVLQDGVSHSYRCWAGFECRMIPIKVGDIAIGLISVGEYYQESNEGHGPTDLARQVAGDHVQALETETGKVPVLSPGQEEGVRVAVAKLADILADIVCYRINLETTQDYFSRVAEDIGTLLNPGVSDHTEASRLAAALGAFTLVSLVNLYIGDLARYMNRLRTDTEHNAISPLTEIFAVAEKLDSLSPETARSRLVDTAEDIMGRVRGRMSTTDLDDGSWWLLTPQRFPLAFIERRIQERLGRRAKDASVELVFSGWAGKVYHDPSLLTILVEILVDNAIKASPEPIAGRPKPQVRISCRSTWEDLVIQVRDSGCGIPEEHQKQIYDRGWSKSQGSYRAGTGLGLHQLKRNLEFLGADVGLDSNVGKGSRFTLTIPRLDQCMPEQQRTQRRKKNVGN